MKGDKTIEGLEKLPYFFYFSFVAWLFYAHLCKVI